MHNINALITFYYFFSFRTPDPVYHRINLGSHNKFKKDPGEQIRYAEKIIGYPDLEMDRVCICYSLLWQ